ncbi:hypothetical protein AcdelDRAFT_4520 [Acidovorax delafieldii 2AN]|uniref:Uncharacterized protein n=1 Tax=Acidovorax delafieldii 2AN TaxID=573060 RepID=C5TC90_ACIDE|nr:hypothetical protein AcdelDRAFT_4520 [Acidovorax delafieldii 2AN]
MLVVLKLLLGYVPKRSFDADFFLQGDVTQLIVD